MNLSQEKLLVIAPHPDDEVLGCYALINKIKKGGGKVFILYLTIGGYGRVEGNKVSSKKWLKECKQVTKSLNVDDFDIFQLNDQIIHLDTIPQEQLIELIESKSKISVAKIKPTIVAIPTIFSTHQDHVVSYNIAITALRPHPQKEHHIPNMVISYEAPEYYFWSAAGEFGKFVPNYFVKLTKNDVKNKIKTLNFYKSQMRKGQRDGNSIDALARIRGSEIGVDYAESYHIHRFFI